MGPRDQQCPEAHVRKRRRGDEEAVTDAAHGRACPAGTSPWRSPGNRHPSWYLDQYILQQHSHVWLAYNVNGRIFPSARAFIVAATAPDAGTTDEPFSRHHDFVWKRLAGTVTIDWCAAS